MASSLLPRTDVLLGSGDLMETASQLREEFSVNKIPRSHQGSGVSL